MTFIITSSDYVKKKLVKRKKLFAYFLHIAYYSKLRRIKINHDQKRNRPSIECVHLDLESTTSTKKIPIFILLLKALSLA